MVPPDFREVPMQLLISGESGFVEMAVREI